jgi:hypothetical protein
MKALAHRRHLLMPSAVKFIGSVLGVGIIGLALTAYLTQLDLSAMFQWLKTVFTFGFLALYILLCSVSLYACCRLSAGLDDPLWFEMALQAANGVATLALTFTLLGISLGIGSLSHQSIRPDTVSAIIQDLTQHFSTAFMTTVLGLPSAAILRAMVTLRKIQLEKCIVKKHLEEVS